MLDLTNLQQANLRRVDARGSDLTTSLLELADLTDLIINQRTWLPQKWYLAWQLLNAPETVAQFNLTGVDLRGAFLRGVQLKNRNLGGIALDNADLRGADLSGVNLRGGTATNANFTGANLDYAAMRDLKMDGRTLLLPRYRLTAALQNGTPVNNVLKATNVLGTNVLVTLYLANSDISRADFSGISFDNLNLSGANLDGCILTSTSFRSANLTGASLQGVASRVANFEGSKLSGANFTGAVMDYVRWIRSTADSRTQFPLKLGLTWDIVNRSRLNRDLTGVDLTNTVLDSADLRLANLSYANFRGGLWNDVLTEGATFLQTILPDGTVKP